ncbi:MULTISPECIES: hypothetical protein [Leptolyngbya]|uniref:hypothetical protein n=1 Tax=Leptolyngbya TaxID=47251 RepID=UPI0016869C99|nr:hypothetical protein [Leptolyngbya sp. FACHB-1624]MBD1856866.1 hypothetical protein [Leptolyngbya sp. FACHB-1624]
MSVTRFLRKSGFIRRQTFLAVMVFPDEASVFQAYRLLHYHGISPEHLAIVGAGYSNPEHVGLLKPMQLAIRKARFLSIILGTLGAISGLGLFLAAQFDLIQMTELESPFLVPALSIVSGFFGAVIGALFGLFGEGTTASIYRHHLDRGQYLLMIEGSERLVRWGQEILSHYSTSSSLY